jgi:hypothetical protein
MLFGARFFVFVIYLLLGVSFIAETALLFWEFGPADALVLATHDSHLFLFFPTLGLVALAAFYRPSCAFVDMYWRHVRFGKLRFVAGFIVIIAVSYLAGMQLAESPYRSVWDLNPMALAADSSEPVGCGSATKPCQRIGILEGVQNVAKVSHQRLGLKEFVRSCEVETLLESDAATERKRFCFASTPLTSTPRLTTNAECCRAQLSYQQAISDLYKKTDARSLTGVVHAALLPAKIMFMLVLLVISVLLAARHAGVTHYYPDQILRIEVGVLVGALAMLFFPLMSQGFVQTTSALYGLHQEEGFKPIVPFMSFMFGAWALLLLFFFFRRHDTELEMAAKLTGVAASTIAVVKYDLIVAIAVRYLGSGAGEIAVALLIGLSVIAVLVLLSRTVRNLAASNVPEAPLETRDTSRPS